MQISHPTQHATANTETFIDTCILRLWPCIHHTIYEACERERSEGENGEWGGGGGGRGSGKRGAVDGLPSGFSDT